ncbi:hypothetical protein RhiirC2_781682 [Rhizophagus irregularis]|uniref:Uncharacterized protein n=1 Tax=Rhizophagus irregularis TaxID=588596 RepID=A0A2N1N4T8_9GLOM|nr:hypothetical protein RhiirC2_781682 [Rhizophagus irregularis]
MFKDYSQVKQIIDKRFNKQFKSRKDQEKYKKKFMNSLKSNKNKWQNTNNEKEMKFLIDQVTSKTKYNMLKDEVFVNYSFNNKHFFELRKKKEVFFNLEDNNIAEQLTSTSKSAIVDNIIENLENLEINEQVEVTP